MSANTATEELSVTRKIPRVQISRTLKTAVMEQTVHLVRVTDVGPGLGYLPLFISRKASAASSALRFLSGLSLSVENCVMHPGV